MKKKLFVLITFLILPFMVDAKEYCKVVRGNGKDIGSEIACGTEHFYIVNANQDEVKMLAKYNLYTGSTIYKEKIEKDDEDTRDDFQYCYDLAQSKGGQIRADNFYNMEGYCFVEVSIPLSENKFHLLDPQPNGWEEAESQCETFFASLVSDDEIKYDNFTSSSMNTNNHIVRGCSYQIHRSIKQKDDALSAHWDENNNYLYPQVGDYYIGSSNMNADLSVDISSANKYNGYFYDMNIGLNSNLFQIMDSYKSFLNNNSYDVLDINLLSLDEIDKVVRINNKKISYSDWYNHTGEIVPPHYEFGQLRDLLSTKHKFLYNTTYWLRNGYELVTQENPMIINGNPYYDDQIGVHNIIFINSLGGVCASGLFGYFGPCQSFLTLSSQLGAGIRPVVTIPNELQYLIQTKTDGNGTIEVVDTALGNETIQFKATSKKGYKLKSIVITTDSGEKVEFKEGDIIKNDDGTYSIDKSVFTMPFENVTIEAKWLLDIMNPKTGRNFIILLISMIILTTGTIIYRKRRDL